MLNIDFDNDENSYDLESWIEAFEKEENDVEKKCDGCKPNDTNRIHSKQTTIDHLPNVVLINLKPTRNTENKSIKFPIDEFVIGKLLRNYKNKSNNIIYRLVTIINYERYSENTVHYFSYGQDLFNGLWWMMIQCKQSKKYH